MKHQESIDNLRLIDNGLIHIEFELERSDPNFFRIARESHLILYRGMIQVLKGSANLEITGRPTKDRQHKYKMDNSPWKEIHKEQLPECQKAWRFSTSLECNPPEINYQNIQIVPPEDNFLISFYDGLAMIQTECFMKKSIISKPIYVTDEEMKVLEWLHEDIRNEYEHFIPKFYSASICSLIKASITSLSLTKKLIFESGNVISPLRYKSLEDNIIKVIQLVESFN